MRKTWFTAAVAVATAGAATLTAAAPANAATTDDHWPASVQGTPTALKAGAATGDYLWHDSHGFHLRVTHPGTGRVVFTGVVHANRAMHATGARLEKGDVFRLSRDKRTLTFAFVDYGHIDGVNFTTDGATRLTVSRLHTGDRTQQASQVFLGSGSGNPSSVPFTLTR
jgi:hypothetical protein